MSLKKQAIQTALNGDWQNAILFNKDLIKENPQDIDALNRLALAYAITGKINLAKTIYLKVVKIDPLNSIALRNLKKIKEKIIKANSNSNYYIKGGCQYEAYTKSASAHKVTIFIKELKKSSRYRNQPSFIPSSESSLVLDKPRKSRGSEGSEIHISSDSDGHYLED